MTIKSKLLITILLLAFSSSWTKAQEFSWPVNIGFYGGLNVNMQSPSMRPTFDRTYPAYKLYDTASFSKNSTDMFPNFGIIANFPINKMITISGRLCYNAMRGSLKEERTYTLDGVTSSFVREL